MQIYCIGAFAKYFGIGERKKKKTLLICQHINTLHYNIHNNVLTNWRCCFIQYEACAQRGVVVERLHCKRPIPICRLFFKIDLITYIAALCLIDFIDWRNIHSLVGIFDPACELLPPWTKELYLCTVAHLSSLWPPPPLPKLNVLFIQTVSVWGGEGGWGVNCAV
jgi:hypothetical protein